MQYDDLDEPCPDLKKIASMVFDSIPADDRTLIESVCKQVLFLRSAASVGSYSHKTEEVRVVVFDLRKLDLSGKRGIFAHEFGHARDYALRRVPPGKDNERAELEANRNLARWGYEDDYRRANEQMPSRYSTIGLD